MYTQVVQNQIDSFLASMHQALHEADQDLRVQRTREDLPARLRLLVTVEIKLSLARLTLARAFP